MFDVFLNLHTLGSARGGARRAPEQETSGSEGPLAASPDLLDDVARDVRLLEQSGQVVGVVCDREWVQPHRVELRRAEVGAWP